MEDVRWGHSGGATHPPESGIAALKAFPASHERKRLG